jgi:hypothetical protein
VQLIERWYYRVEFMTPRLRHALKYRFALKKMWWTGFRFDSNSVQPSPSPFMPPAWPSRAASGGPRDTGGAQLLGGSDARASRGAALPPRERRRLGSSDCPLDLTFFFSVLSRTFLCHRRWYDSATQSPVEKKIRGLDHAIHSLLIS